MRDFYPPIEPFKSFMLPVDHGHELYVECCGNPNGFPILFIHGGPGAGCSENDRRFFDPKHYCIILFDQRGCGRSLPFGSLENNTTQNLIDDIEKIRHHLNIQSWHLFGGSWGSTLALAYAQSFPNYVTALILRGIFLGRQQDSHWFTQGGATRLFPDKAEKLNRMLSVAENESVLDKAYQLVTDEANKEKALDVAKVWAGWELSIGYLKSQPDNISDTLNPDFCWTLARHEIHYLIHQCFLKANQLIEQCHSIANIPVTIVHGRYDIICPMDNAWTLHKALPNSTLHICNTSGHASSEPQIKDKLIEATNALK